MKPHTYLTAAMAAALVGGPSLAQQHAHSPAMDMGSQVHDGGGMTCMSYMAGGMMTNMLDMPSMGMHPAMLMGVQDALGLSADQSSALAELASSVEAARGEHMAALSAERSAAENALDAGDLEAYERHLRVVADHLVQNHVTMAEASIEARSLLTPEQLERVERSMDMMGHWMGGGMSGMAMMMHGGRPGSGN